MAETFWIDVRSQDEFKSKHHPEAVNIPHGVIRERIAEVTSDKNADIRVYCRSGNRSGIAKRALESIGYTNVINEGGVKDVLKKLEAGEKK